MRSQRLLALTAPSLLALVVLAGCSGDDSEEPAANPESSSSSTTERDDDGVLDDGSGDKQRNCKVKVEVTGAAEASWKMKGQSVQPANGSPAAYYTAEKDDRLVQVFAGGGDIETSSAVVSVDGVTYTTNPQDPAGVEASDDGTSAEVDAQADSTDGGSVDLVAEFTCGGPDKSKKSKKD